VLASKFAPPNAPPTSDADVKVFKSLVTGTLVNGQTVDVTNLSTFDSVGLTAWNISNEPGTRGEAFTRPGFQGVTLRATVSGTSFSSTLAIKSPPGTPILNSPVPSGFNVNLPSFPSALAPSLVLNVNNVPSIIVGSQYDLIAASGFAAPGITVLGDLFGFAPTRTYTSSNPGVGIIENGKFVAVGPGQTTVRFSIDSPYSNGQTVFDERVFTVRKPISTQLKVPQINLPSAQTMVTHTIATFDNGQTADLGYLASLVSGNNGIANPYSLTPSTSYPVPNYNAYVLGQNPGVVTITSTWNSLVSTATITTREKVDYVTLGATAASLSCPTFDQVRMIATLTDGTTADLTGLDRVSFGTTNPSVVTVSNSWLNPGKLTQISNGTANLTGRYFYYDNGSFTAGESPAVVPIAYPCGVVPPA
jgi:hypothetical protein